MTCDYSPKALHLPLNPSNEINFIINNLDQFFKLELNDGRSYEGKLTGFDKFGNIVLTDSIEFYRTQKRPMPMVIIPLEFVIQIQKKKL